MKKLKFKILKRGPQYDYFLFDRFVGFALPMHTHIYYSNLFIENFKRIYNK